MKRTLRVDTNEVLREEAMSLAESPDFTDFSVK
jgi:hypothetical protein